MNQSRPVSAEALLQNLHHSLRAVIGSVTGRSFHAAGEVLRKLQHRLEFDQAFAQVEVIGACVLFTVVGMSLA